jgi:hypothetical protein
VFEKFVVFEKIDAEPGVGTMGMRMRLAVCGVGLGWVASIGLGNSGLGNSPEGAGGGADFYVAPWGSDSNPGTLADPFGTIDRARDAVRVMTSGGLSAPVEVVIRGGTYRIEEPIVFGVEDSGGAQTPITYRAYPGEEPVVSGGRVIEGWVVQANGTWTAPLGDVASGDWTFRELFVNGQRRPRARHPNTGFNRVAHLESGERFEFNFYEGDLPESTQLKGGELAFLHDWDMSRVAIETVDHGSNLLMTSEAIGAQAPIFAPDYFEDHPRYFVENDIALLDAAGEWYLNETSGVLTYMPGVGETPGTVEVVAPIARELLVVRGIFATAGGVNPVEAEYVEHLHFDGLAFEHCAWPLPSGGLAAYQAGFWEWRDLSEPYIFPTAVTFEQARECSFRNGRVAHVGGWGLTLGRTCKDSVCEGNVISDIAGNGILIGEDKFRVFDGSQWWLLGEEAAIQAASGNVVRNNLVERCGEVYLGCVGVWVGLANGTEVSHNLIRFLPQTAVSVGGIFNAAPSPCHNNVITRNHIHDLGVTMSDAGGVYTLGLQPGTVISENLIHSIPFPPGSARNVGIFVDQQTTDVVIEENAIFRVARSAMKFHITGHNIVRNNTMLVLPGELPMFFVNMSSTILTFLGNTTLIETGLVDCHHSVYEIAPLAGPEAPYLESFVGSAVEDGCLTCEDVTYSGVFLDDCGVCDGDGSTCSGIPTVSQWGLVALGLLVTSAGTVVFGRRASVLAR